MPYDEWRAKHQTVAGEAKTAAFERNRPKE
jgi:hypothetical protein